ITKPSDVLRELSPSDISFRCPATARLSRFGSCGILTYHCSMLTLEDFDGRLMDGFTFCKKVYKLLDEVYASQDGVKRLRLRDRLTKKLIEELLPLTHYMRSRYTEGRQMRVRWVDGN